MKSIYILLSMAVFSCGNTVLAKKSVEYSDKKEGHQKKSNPNLTNNSSAQKIINLKDYGAKGLGVSSIKEDAEALRKAIADLNKAGGGKLYVPNPPKFYAFSGDGVFVGDNVEIYGDGKGKSEIRNVSPMSGNFMKGPIFLFSTYGAVDRFGIFQDGIDQFPIQDAQKKAQYVVLKDPSNGSKLLSGEVVILGAGKFLHAETENKGRFHYMELNEISSISNGKVSFKYPLSIPLNSDNKSNSPVIININNTLTKNSKLNIKNGSSKNIYIHDLTLSQAQTDELHNNAPINQDGGDNENGLSGIWQPGGAFGSRFENLEINAYGGLEGNMFTRCNFNNLTIKATKKFFDFGYGSSNDTVHDITWQYMPSVASNFATAFIICNDGTHDILMYKINSSGDWNGESLITMSQAKSINMHDMTFNFPNYNKPNILIQIADKEGVHSRDVSLNNIKVTVGSARAFLRIAGDNTPEPNRNINITNASFKGTILVNDNQQSFTAAKKPNKKNGKGAGKAKVDKGQALIAKNVDGLTLNNIDISSGELYIENCNNSNIQKLVAPSSTLILKKSNNAKISQISVRNRVND